MAKTPDYMIPLDFPVQNYIYAPEPDYAHWTSSPVWAQTTFWRNNPRKLLKVPTTIPKTSRKSATRISAIGKKGHWPIGDLYHARLAMIYILSPSHKKVRNKVIAAVKENYPMYDWDRWLEEHETKKKHRAVANPMHEIDSFRQVAPNRFMFRYKEHGGFNNYTVEADTEEEAIRKFKAEDAFGNVGTVDARMLAAANPAPEKYVRSNPRYVRSNPRTDGMPDNAGPYLPDMFPYGVGGRPVALSNPVKKTPKR